MLKAQRVKANKGESTFTTAHPFLWNSSATEEAADEYLREKEKTERCLHNVASFQLAQRVPSKASFALSRSRIV